MKPATKQQEAIEQNISPHHTLADLVDSFMTLPKNLDREIFGIAVDSREVKPGFAFVAVPGRGKFDGRDFIQDAVAAGAVAVLSELSSNTEIKTGYISTGQSLQNGIPHIQVPKLNEIVGVIADRFFRKPSVQMQMIGITGTNGKTTVASLLTICLQKLQTKSAFVGTHGYGCDLDNLDVTGVTTPGALKLQTILDNVRGQGAEAVCMEVSSHAIDQNRITGTRFDTLVLTNVTRDHIEYHGSEKAYKSTKARLFLEHDARNIVLNLDDPTGRAILQQKKQTERIIGYSLHSSLAHPIENIVYGHHVQARLGSLAMLVTYKNETVKIQTALVGSFNAANILAVIATLLSQDFSLHECQQALYGARPVNGRMEVLGGGEQPLVIVDYAHTPDALEAVLSNLQRYCDKKLICVFGCGGERDRGKRSMMGKVAEKYCDQIILTNDNPRKESPQAIIAEVLQGILSPWAIDVKYDRTEAIVHAMNIATKGDVVLVAGKGQETYQIIGDEKISFSDKEKVEFLLKLKEGS